MENVNKKKSLFQKIHDIITNSDDDNWNKQIIISRLVENEVKKSEMLHKLFGPTQEEYKASPFVEISTSILTDMLMITNSLKVDEDKKIIEQIISEISDITRFDEKLQIGKEEIFVPVLAEMVSNILINTDKLTENGKEIVESTIQKVLDNIDEKNQELLSIPSKTTGNLAKDRLTFVEKSKCLFSKNAYEDILLHFTDFINNNRKLAQLLVNNEVTGISKSLTFEDEETKKYFFIYGFIFCTKYYGTFIQDIGNGRVSPFTVSYAFNNFILEAAKIGRGEIFGDEYIGGSRYDFMDRGRLWDSLGKIKMLINKKQSLDYAFDDVLIFITNFINNNQYQAEALSKNKIISDPITEISLYYFLETYLRSAILLSPGGLELVKNARNRNVTIDEVGKIFGEYILNFDIDTLAYQKSSIKDILRFINFNIHHVLDNIYEKPPKYKGLISKEFMEKFNISPGIIKPRNKLRNIDNDSESAYDMDNNGKSITDNMLNNINNFGELNKGEQSKNQKDEGSI